MFLFLRVTDKEVASPNIQQPAICLILAEGYWGPYNEIGSYQGPIIIIIDLFQFGLYNVAHKIQILNG